MPPVVESGICLRLVGPWSHELERRATGLTPTLAAECLGRGRGTDESANALPTTKEDFVPWTLRDRPGSQGRDRRPPSQDRRVLPGENRLGRPSGDIAGVAGAG